MFSSYDPRDEAFLCFLDEVRTVNIGEQLIKLDISDEQSLTLSQYRKVLLLLSKEITSLSSSFYIRTDSLKDLCLKVSYCILKENSDMLSDEMILQELRKLRKQRVHALNIANGYVEWVSVRFRQQLLNLTQQWWVLACKLNNIDIKEEKQDDPVSETAARVIVWSYCLVWANNIRSSKKLKQLTYYAS